MKLEFSWISHMSTVATWADQTLGILQQVNSSSGIQNHLHHHLYGASQESDKYSLPSWMNAALLVLKDTMQDKEALWFHLPTLNLHSLQHWRIVAAVCSIYKMHCSYSHRLFWQHPSKSNFYQEEQGHQAHITIRFLSRSHTNLIWK